jgi:hypothetical protein
VTEEEDEISAMRLDFALLGRRKFERITIITIGFDKLVNSVDLVTVVYFEPNGVRKSEMVKFSE